MEIVKTIQLEPTKEQLTIWINKFVPDKDIFFIEEKDLNHFKDYLEEVLIFPRDEFHNHSNYSQIEFINSYTYWNISKLANYVIVAHPDWVVHLPSLKKRDLFSIQIKMGRGLILPLSFSIGDEKYVTEYILEDKIVIQQHMWMQLSMRLKESILREYAVSWDSGNGIETPENAPEYIKKYANQFPLTSGSNCLSAVLFAITGQEWMLHEWVHPKTFQNGLSNADYVETNHLLKPGDVVTWVNTEGVTQHASYHIGNNSFFNKNGQTFFNPWKIVRLEQLREEWGQYEMKIYTKQGS